MTVDPGGRPHTMAPVADRVPARTAAAAGQAARAQTAEQPDRLVADQTAADRSATDPSVPAQTVARADPLDPALGAAPGGRYPNPAEAAAEPAGSRMAARRERHPAPSPAAAAQLAAAAAAVDAAEGVAGMAEGVAGIARARCHAAEPADWHGHQFQRTDRSGRSGARARRVDRSRLLEPDCRHGSCPRGKVYPDIDQPL